MRRGSCLVLIPVSLLVGCNSQSVAVVPVSGKVTLDGQPLVGATLSFQPITDKSSTNQAAMGSYGKTDAEGKFTLRLIDPDKPGALVGRHAVTVTTAVSADPASDELKVKQPERLPVAARTKEVEIPVGGTDRANLELSSRP